MLMYLVRRLCLFAVAAGVLGAAAALMPDHADDSAAFSRPGDPSV